MKMMLREGPSSEVTSSRDLESLQASRRASQEEGRAQWSIYGECLRKSGRS